jgi:hypothetical protein
VVEASPGRRFFCGFGAGGGGEIDVLIRGEVRGTEALALASWCRGEDGIAAEQMGELFRAATGMSSW